MISLGCTQLECVEAATLARKWAGNGFAKRRWNRRRFSKAKTYRHSLEQYVICFTCIAPLLIARKQNLCSYDTYELRDQSYIDLFLLLEGFSTALFLQDLDMHSWLIVLLTRSYGQTNWERQGEFFCASDFHFSD